LKTAIIKTEKEEEMKKLGVFMLVATMAFLFVESSYADLNDGLVAYYPFNGNANDESGNGYNGVANGASLTNDRNGIANSAYTFDGDNDYISTSPINVVGGSNQMALSLWLKVDSFPSQISTLIDQYRNYQDSRVFSFQLDTGYYASGTSLRLGVYGSNPNENKLAVITPNLNLNENVWYHAIAIYNAGAISIFLDGNKIEDLIISAQNGSENFLIADSLERLGMGLDLQTYTWKFNGALDDIRIYNRALSDCEIQELFTGQPVCTQVYSCTGFESPLANGPVTVKKNRVLPVKAQIFNSNDSLITDTEIVASPVIQVFFDSGIGGDPIDVTDDALPAGLGTEGNQFVFTDGDKWQFNLKTIEYTATGTYSIFIVSGNESEYIIDPSCEAQFVIK
jgi:hypothetical protein